MDLVERLCGRTLWLAHGRLAQEGATMSVVAAYRESCLQSSMLGARNHAHP
jgi:ABC-type polysaccharide/polyol phosphate transport system ATPase subunit